MTGEVIEDAVANRSIFKCVSADERDKAAGGVRQQQSTGSEAGRAAARARKQLFELAICNPFDIFFTLTLDTEKIDRYDYKAAVKRLGQWFSNLVTRHGFIYVAVPELHKDGAVHFHGLCSSPGLRLVDSGHKDKAGRAIYNVSNWRMGFSTAVKLDGDYHNVCKYICKYVTKAQEGGTIGGRYFYHGGDLQGPLVRYYRASFEEAAQGGKVVSIEGACGLQIAYQGVV